MTIWNIYMTAPVRDTHDTLTFLVVLAQTEELVLK
jgi:hypothetical protein